MGVDKVGGNGVTGVSRTYHCHLSARVDMFTIFFPIFSTHDDFTISTFFLINLTDSSLWVLILSCISGRQNYSRLSLIFKF